MARRKKEEYPVPAKTFSFKEHDFIPKPKGEMISDAEIDEYYENKRNRKFKEDFGERF